MSDYLLCKPKSFKQMAAQFAIVAIAAVGVKCGMSDSEGIEEHLLKPTQVYLGGYMDASFHLGGRLKPIRDMEAFKRLDPKELEYIAGVKVLKVDSEYSSKIYGTESSPAKGLREKIENIINNSRNWRDYDAKDVSLFRNIFKDEAKKLYGDGYKEIFDHMSNKDIIKIAMTTYTLRIGQEGQNPASITTMAITPDFGKSPIQAGVLFIDPQDKLMNYFRSVGDGEPGWIEVANEPEKHYMAIVFHELGHIAQKPLNKELLRAGGWPDKHYLQELDAEIQAFQAFQAVVGDTVFISKLSAGLDLEQFQGYVNDLSDPTINGIVSYNRRRHNIEAHLDQFLEQGIIEFTPGEIHTATKTLALKTLEAIGFEHVHSFENFGKARSEYLTQAYAAVGKLKYADLRYGLHKVIDNGAIKLSDAERYLSDNLLESMNEFGVEVKSGNLKLDELKKFNTDYTSEIGKALFFARLPELFFSAWKKTEETGIDPLTSKELKRLKGKAENYGISEQFLEVPYLHTPKGGYVTFSDDIKIFWKNVPSESYPSL